jgi:hypothetical protein
MDAHTLVSLFGQEAGVALALGESRTVALAFEGGPTVQIEHDLSLDALHCYVVIGPFPVELQRGAALSRLLLQANAFGRDTDGAILGVDADEIIVSRRLELGRADTAWLRTTVESLVGIAKQWQTRINEAGIATEPNPLPSSMPDLGMRA